jgi:dCMP deaminase
MRTVKSWDQYFMEMVELAASRSKDPSTQIGAVIVNASYDVLSTGYNGMAPGMIETEEIWERPTKYDYVIHGETNAIIRAARLGIAIGGGTLYTTGFPCNNCARNVVAAGIKKIVCFTGNRDWDGKGLINKDLYDKTGVRYVLLREDYTVDYDSYSAYKYHWPQSLGGQPFYTKVENVDPSETLEKFKKRIRKD